MPVPASPFRRLGIAALAALVAAPLAVMAVATAPAAPAAAAAPVPASPTGSGSGSGSGGSAAIALAPASQPGAYAGADPSAVRAFVLRHRSALAEVRRPALAAAPGAPASSCYGTAHTQAPGAATQLIVVSYGLFYDCTVDAWELDVTTQDSWADADLVDLEVAVDTDDNAATGCNGYDRAVAATYDTNAGLVAATVITPSCDQTSWLIADPFDGIAHPTPDTAQLSFGQEDLGNPTAFRWHGDMIGTAETNPDRFPLTGNLTETGYPPVPANNACPSGLISGLPARMAVLSDPARAAAAGLLLARAGLGSVTPESEGVVRFTGDPAAAAAALGRAGIGADVSTDHLVHYDDVPNDPMFSTQWNLPPLNMVAAWDITHGSAGVAVADIDSGVDGTHPELQGKLTPGYDVGLGTALAAGNTDDVGHGTAVAGVIGAATNNGIGVAGVGWNTMVTPIKLDGGEEPTTSELVIGLRWAVANGNRIVNMSLGTCGQATLASAVQLAEQHGVLLVASAGNGFLTGNPIEYPAGYPGVIAVGATGHDGTRAYYSETGSQVSLVAPGGSADGTPTDDMPLLQAGGGYTTEAGTSFAAPEVAAVAALVLAADPSLTPSDAGALVTATASHVGTSPDVNYGAGMLDAAAALTAAARLKRAAGATRYGTAVALSRLAFPTGATTAYVVSGETFADALSTGALAARAQGPILLTDTCALPPTTATELARLKAKTVYVIGGANAVCPAVLTAVSQAAGVPAIRVAGADRYGTDAALAAIGWPAKVTTVYVTTGVNFPDGLTGSARAAKDGSPILLTDTCALPPSIRAMLVRLAPTSVKVIGGSLAVCPAVLTAIAAAVPGAQVVRIAGASRVDTAVKVMQDGWTSATSVIVASAANFPDALSAGAYAALTKSPLLINDACRADPEVGAAVAALGSTSMTAMGGSLALCGAAVAPLVVRLQS